MPDRTWGVIDEGRKPDKSREPMVYNEVMALRTELDEAWAQLNRLAPEGPDDCPVPRPGDLR
jgi:hypothetical protein